MFKKGLFLLSILFCFQSTAVADTVGHIDLDKILTDYKEAQKIQTMLEEKQVEYEELVKEKQEDLENQLAKAEKDNASEVEKQEIVTEMLQELEPIREELLTLQGALQQQLMNQIMSAAKNVGEEYGLTVIIDKRFVYYGGFDLTSYVIEKLNSD